MRLRLSHDDPTNYNTVQKLLYVGILLVGVLIVMSGLALWKPIQFSELLALFGSFQTARLVHFLCMTAIVLFVVRPCLTRASCAAYAGCHGDRRTGGRRRRALGAVTACR